MARVAIWSAFALSLLVWMSACSSSRTLLPTAVDATAPAWNLNRPWAATMRPSRLTPILTVIDEPEVGPVARNTSSRLIMILTGWPDLRDSAGATGST